MYANVKVEQAGEYVSITWTEQDGQTNSVMSRAPITLTLGGTTITAGSDEPTQPDSHENGHPSAQKISPDTADPYTVTLYVRPPGSVKWTIYAQLDRVKDEADLETMTRSMRRLALRLREKQPDWTIKMVTEETR